jgi:hypothetical protein
MNPNPGARRRFHWLGALACGSFYAPYRGRKELAVGNVVARRTRV